MNDDKLKIALTFSGGGYRAAAFHLGTLSYLHTVKMEGEDTLLGHVAVLSTISGGTITGLRYMLGLVHQEPMEDICRGLYTFLTEADLATEALGHLSGHEGGRPASLIRAMSDIYDRELFGGARLGVLMDHIEQLPVRHFAANATDFVNGLPFRFQVTEKIQHPGEEAPQYGVIGNGLLPIPRDVARHIRLADILACSSCFPGGFEPMVFPDDFKLADSCRDQAFLDRVKPFGIMDGGIVDNQGIEPVLLAEQRMERDAGPEKKDKSLDLIIVSDVASPGMDAYKESNVHLPSMPGGLTLNKLSACMKVTAAATTLVVAGALWWAPHTFLSGALAALWLFVMALWMIGTFAKKKLTGWLKGTVVQDGVGNLLKLEFNDLATLLANRANSVMLLVSSVFMKHLRRMGYRSIYKSPEWENRTAMNAVYQLRPGESWAAGLQTGSLPPYLEPSAEMQENSEKAAAMGTTLWFTGDDRANGVPEALIAAGQYTVCWNLLRYINRIKKHPANLNEHHLQLLACESRLREDWERLKGDPFSFLMMIR